MVCHLLDSLIFMLLHTFLARYVTLRRHPVACSVYTVEDQGGMNSARSSLNPNAASYIPLSKRVVEGNVAPQSQPTKGSSSQHEATLPQRPSSDEMYDMELEYLQMTFPGLSHQSLIDVYMANGGDMEAAIDMLNDLESTPCEFPESLPETLDIGDVAEAVPAAEQGTLKLKKVASEGADASSSTHRPPSQK